MRDHLSGPNPSPDAKNIEAQERQAACDALHAECVSHQIDIENQFEGVPGPAISYLVENCPQEQIAPTVQYLLTTKTTELGGDLTIIPVEAWSFVLDDCIAKAALTARSSEIAAKSEQRAANAETIAANDEANEQQRTTNDVLRIVRDVSREAAKTEGGVDNILERTREVLENHPELQTVEAKEIAFKKLNQVEAMLADMRGVFTDPVGQAAFEDILAGSKIDLTSDNLSATFAPILQQVEASEAISAVDKVRLRHIVTGTDVQDTLTETITNEDGTTEYRWSQNNKRELRAGVGGYASPTGRQMIEARAGDHVVTKDVTGWSGEDIGLVVELMHYWHMSESDGTTGFIENVYKIDFSILDQGGAFDPLTVNKFRQVISHLTGGYAGYDGDIENFEHQRQLIQNQNRLLSQSMTTFGWENDQAATTRMLQRLGMQDEGGNINLEVIESFGHYTQRYYASGSPDNLDVLTFLSERHPKLVRPLSETERMDHFLDI